MTRARRGLTNLGLVFALVAVATSCGGGSNRAAPEPASTDLCTLFRNFQPFHFTARSGAPVPPEQYEVFFKGLVDGATKLAQAKPELRSTLDALISGDLALAKGQPIPAASPSQPAYDVADATIAEYQTQACGSS